MMTTITWMLTWDTAKPLELHPTPSSSIFKKQPFYLEIIPNLKKKKKSTKEKKLHNEYPHIHFTQIHLLLTFYLICFMACVLSPSHPPSHSNTYTQLNWAGAIDPIPKLPGLCSPAGDSGLTWGQSFTRQLWVWCAYLIRSSWSGGIGAGKPLAKPGASLVNRARTCTTFLFSPS